MSPGKRQAPGVASEGKSESPDGGRALTYENTSRDPDQYVDAADRLLLAALREGFYILAVRCRLCGAPLTAKRSRARGIGPECRRRAGDAL